MRRRAFGAIACIVVLLAAGAYAIHLAQQPPYRFLAGLEPIWEGDPTGVATTASARAAKPGKPTATAYMYVYSVKGSYEVWQQKIDQEVKRLHIKPVSRGEQWTDWLLGGERPNLVTPVPSQAIGLAKNSRVKPGENIMRANERMGSDKGWVTIWIYESHKPTVFTRLGEWWQSVTGS